MSRTSYFVHSCANALQKFHWMHDHSARALQQRFDDQRGDFAVMLFEQARQRLDAIDVTGRARFFPRDSENSTRKARATPEIAYLETRRRTKNRRPRTSLRRCRRDRHAPARRFASSRGFPMLRQYCSAIFSATSTAVEPSSEKKMCSSAPGSTRRNRAASSSAGSCVNPAKITCSSLRACSAMAVGDRADARGRADSPTRRRSRRSVRAPSAVYR